MKRLEHTVLVLKGHSCQCQLMCFIRSEYALSLSLWLKISSHLQCAVVWNYACPSMWNTSECQMIYFQLESSSTSFKLNLFGSKCLFSKTYTRVILVLLAGRFNWTFLYQFCATCSRNKRCIFSLISNFLAVSIDLEDTTGCFHGCHTVFAQFFPPSSQATEHLCLCDDILLEGQITCVCIHRSDQWGVVTSSRCL